MGDERWRHYETNIEVPLGRDRETVLQKFKAKWYKREIVRSFQDPYTVCVCYRSKQIRPFTADQSTLMITQSEMMQAMIP